VRSRGQAEGQGAAVGELDLKRSLYHEKELVGLRMLVPGIVSGQYRKAQTARVHPAQDLVPVLLGDGCRLLGDVHHDQRRESHWLAGIGLECGH
jgi:hypothetical protein